VDASRAALEVADANLELNRSKLLNNGDGVDWIEADAFELLREYEATGERFRHHRAGPARLRQVEERH